MEAGLPYWLTRAADSGLFIVRAGEAHAEILDGAGAVSEAVPGFE